AEIEPENDILEIGSGSGWSACLAGYLAYPGEVTSLEVIPELTQLAEENRRKANNYRLSKVKFRCSDIFKELPDRSYDRIIFTAGINDEQEKKIDELSKRLLKKNGILICPYKDGPLIIIKKNRFFQKKKYTKEHYRFVPLVS
ncbi:MAG TPA: methyltransferase domain-containing protein, partial [Candidatus Woesearchaeota archaeon]|nr:methyltransferase domain-containing protein [Candidatus Woesearchaeota archaeon]